MVNTFHKQVIHAILQPVMLRAPGCLCGLHRGSHGRPMTFTHHTPLISIRSTHQLRGTHFSNQRPQHAVRCCRGACYATAAPLSKARASSFPSSACKAAPAGHTASPPSQPRTNGPGLPGVVSDSEGSDEDDADSPVQVEGLSDEHADVDEAVTGYLQDGLAKTVLVKSKTEAHEQVRVQIDCYFLPLTMLKLTCLQERCLLSYNFTGSLCSFCINLPDILVAAADKDQVYLQTCVPACHKHTGKCMSRHSKTIALGLHCHADSFMPLTSRHSKLHSCLTKALIKSLH